MDFADLQSAASRPVRRRSEDEECKRDKWREIRDKMVFEYIKGLYAGDPSKWFSIPFLQIAGEDGRARYVCRPDVFHCQIR